MRLREFIEPQRKTVSVDDERLKRNVKDAGTDIRGKQGWFSRVHGKDPHTIDKFNVRDLPANPDAAQDGFWIWANAIMENKLFEKNPHFPRIYEETAYRGKEREKRRYKMERLFTPDEFSREQLETMMEQYLTERGLSEIKNFADTANDAWELFCGMIERTSPKSISSKQLLAAAEVAYELSQKHGYNVDIHDNNVMLRKTQFGIIPVISDPLGLKNR